MNSGLQSEFQDKLQSYTEKLKKQKTNKQKELIGVRYDWLALEKQGQVKEARYTKPQAVKLHLFENVQSRRI